MKKTIKYAVKNEGSKLVFQVTEQSHIGREFGDDETTVVAPNGLSLRSYHYPEFNSSRSILYVRGDETHKDETWIEIPVDQLAKIIEAIEWYNTSQEIEDDPESLVEQFIEEDYQEDAQQFLDFMQSLKDGEVDELDEIPDYQEAAVAAYVFAGLTSFKNLDEAIEGLGCQKDGARKLFEALAKQRK